MPTTNLTPVIVSAETSKSPFEVWNCPPHNRRDQNHAAGEIARAVQALNLQVS